MGNGMIAFSEIAKALLGTSKEKVKVILTTDAPVTWIDNPFTELGTINVMLLLQKGNVLTEVCLLFGIGIKFHFQNLSELPFKRRAVNITIFYRA